MTQILDKAPINGEVANALTADRYTAWIDTRDQTDVTFAIHSVGTGSPVGAFSLEGSNDGPTIKAEREAGVAPASSAAKKSALTAVAHGDSPSISGSAAKNLILALVGGLPRYVRVKFAYASGGSASSLWYCFTSGRNGV